MGGWWGKGRVPTVVKVSQLEALKHTSEQLGQP